MSRLEGWFLDQWQRNGAWQVILRPIAALYGILLALRRLLYRVGIFRTWHPPVPLIVVGNLSAGGTGKTPLTIAICELLTARGLRVGVVSRGYGSQGGAHLIEPRAVRPAGIVLSDETELIARRTQVPVSVDGDRARAAQRLLARVPSVDVIVSDDGLQHSAMGRTLELVVVDGTRGFGNAQLLPAGPLREPLRRLRSVDAVVVNRTMSNSVGAVDFSKLTKSPVVSMLYGNEQLRAVGGGDAVTVDAARSMFAGKRLVAIAGIGNPQRFFLHLIALGFVLSERRAFVDHHVYTCDDFAEWNDERTVVLMTEKDAVKCERFVYASTSPSSNTSLDAAATPNAEPLRAPLWALCVDALLPGALEDLLTSHVDAQKIVH